MPEDEYNKVVGYINENHLDIDGYDKLMQDIGNDKTIVVGEDSFDNLISNPDFYS